MVLTAANGWITAQIIAKLPDGVEPRPAGSHVPLDNLLAAVGAQVWVMAAIFAVGSLIVVRAPVRDAVLGGVEAGLPERDLGVKWLSSAGDARASRP